MAVALRAPVCAKGRTGGKAVARRGVLQVRAAASSESAAPAAVAVLAPLGAVALSSALISSGTVSAEGISSYLHTTAGFVFDAAAAGSVPEFVTKYFHGLNMATVLLAMGGYGAYLGWRVRNGGRNEATIGTSDTAAQLHPKLMIGMTLFFAAGGQGGLLFNLLQGRPILESPHAVTALAGLLLLAGNGALSTFMKGSPNLKTTHAFLGSALMAVFFVHAGLGIKQALEL